VAKLKLKQLARRQVADEIPVGCKKIKGRQVAQRNPAHIVEDSVGDFATERADGKKLQIYCPAAAVNMANASHEVADIGVDTELFIKLADQRLFRRFSPFDFPPWELPLEGHGLIGAALTDENLVATQNEGSDDKAYGLRSVLFDFFLHATSV
jgi:hypothetical protein